MPPELLKLLGLPETASVDDVMKVCGELLRIAATAADEGGDKAGADAANGAADAVDAAAGDEEKKDPAAEQQAASLTASVITAAVNKAVGAVVQPLVKKLEAVTKRIDSDDRARLLSSAAINPGIRKWLEGQPVDVVRSYCANLSPADVERPGAKKGNGELTSEDRQLCSMLGLSEVEFKKQRDTEITNTNGRAV